MKKQRSRQGVSRTKLIAQPHGGALLEGGLAGNRGGTGRPPSALRQLCRDALGHRLSLLEEILDGAVVKKCPCCDHEFQLVVRPADRLRALELLAKYGLGPAGGKEGSEEGPPVVVQVNTGATAPTKATLRSLIRKQR